MNIPEKIIKIPREKLQNSHFLKALDFPCLIPKNIKDPLALIYKMKKTWKKQLEKGWGILFSWIRKKFPR